MSSRVTTAVVRPRLVVGRRAEDQAGSRETNTIIVHVTRR
jgi:hypothetical protein